MQKRTREPTYPTSLLDPEFRYIPSAQTDVTRTWRRFGWTPPDSRKQALMKAKLNG